MPSPSPFGPRVARAILGVSILGALSACPGPTSAPQASPPSPQTPSTAAATPPTAAEAKAFVERYNRESEKLGIEVGKTAWVAQTFITDDTQFVSAKAGERWLNFRNQMIEEAKRFDGLKLDPATARALMLIKQGVTMPAPRDGDRVAELSSIASKLEAEYGSGEVCTGEGDKRSCRDLEALTELMAESRNYDALLDAWRGWRSVSPKMKKPYERFAELMNEGARELGFADTGELWRSGYDMSPDAFSGEAERLWGQVSPLYEQLHCYVRNRLAKTYGDDKVKADEPIPAHLLGNMWAQEWNNIYPLVRPFPPQARLDIGKALKQQKYTAKKMVRSAESFYTSMGLVALPESFYEKSLFEKPSEYKVVCHASAWDIDARGGDLRIKMCIDPTEEELITIYHELGHIYYYQYYKDLPYVFQSGAHDGFHEAIGDALTLSMTPGFYKQIGLVDRVVDNEKALINLQLKEALEKIAFLPFGKLVDQWRWDVFSGKVAPAQWNQHWWKLRTKYQGIAAPIPRAAGDFDPGAKYHIPNNTPYTRYFLARILQFQFHRALCKAAGHEGPLHTCSIYESKAAGEKLAAMLSMGRSQAWPNALEKLTGTRQMDASAIVDYFEPLMKWLTKENEGRACGW